MLKRYTKEFPRNISLAVPVMIGQVGQILVGLIDNVMVGKLGAAPLAAVSLGNAVFAIALSLAIGFSLSITPLTAEADGQGNTSEGGNILKNGVTLCTVLGVLLYALVKLLQPFLGYLNQPEEVVILSKPYLDMVALSIIPFTIFMAFKQFSDGMSATRYAMIATIIGNLVNVFLNYVLIYGKWGFPRLELEGAALGTLISRILMVALIIFILKSKKQFVSYFKNFFKGFINKQTISKILTLGFPVAMQMLFEFGFFTSSILLSGKLSTEDQAANQIALNLASLAFMVAVGLGVAATVRAGNQIGRKDYKELVRIIRSILLLVLILELILAVFFITTKNILPLIYINDTTVITIASQLLIIVAWFQLSDGLQVSLLGTLRGMQDVNVPTGLIFVAYWCIGFPVAYYLGQKHIEGAFGIWIGLLIGLFTSSLLLFLRYRYLIAKYLRS